VPPKITPLSEELDALDILSAVGRNEIPLTIMDSDAVDAYRAYRSDVAVVATIKEKAPIAWAVRKDDTALRRALNTFIREYISVAGVAPVAALDLDDIKRRGVLRMVLPNTGAAFFFHQGIPMGFQYVMAQKLCRKLGVRLEVVVPRKKTDMLPLLVEGHADVVAATMTATRDRLELVDFAKPLMHVDEVLIQRADQPAIRSVEELANRTITVQANSSYLRTLTAIKATVPGLKVTIVPIETTSEELVDGVANGTYDFTVSDFNLIAADLSFRKDIIATLRIGRGRPIGYAIRKSSKQLKAALDSFSAYWAPQLAGGSFSPASKPKKSVTSDKPHPFAEHLDSVGKQYAISPGLLERWMMEVSNGDPKSISWFGARGLLHVMPHIAAQWEITSEALHDPKTGLDAGAKWLNLLRRRLPKSITANDALCMALAATRVGLDHISDARELASKRGWDPNRWTGHVARALAELTRPEVAAGARYGYCPGTEAVRFVSKVFEK
jgi:membrane-bound lytic murein transglycosylase F